MASAADFALDGPLGGTSLGEALAPARARVRPRLLPVARDARAQLQRSGRMLARSAAEIASNDLVIDLGDSIGSGRWWRGMATVAALSGAVLALGLQLPVLTGSVPPARAPSVVEESRLSTIGALRLGSDTGRQVPPTARARRLSEVPERPRVSLSANVGGGGLVAALRRAGVGRDDLSMLSGLMSGVANPAALASGTRLDLVMGRRESRALPRPLEYLAFRAAFDSRVEVRRAPDGQLQFKRIAIRVDDTPLRVTGQIGGSLQQAARAAGLPQSVILEYLQQMRHTIDFEREVGRRDRFEMIVAHRRAETGETQMGQLLYAGLVNGRSNISLMRWGPRGEFFWQNGEGVKKGLIRTPIAGARLSSGFGMRFHPVLGYSRMHRGVDFAARTGTPIVASASGKVILAGWGGGYGNVVVIDHGRGMKTRYAHMHRIGVRVGQQVSQGQNIGQVGSTGLSTGPHLHYEVWQNGKAVDPRSAKFFGGSQLAGADLAGFKSRMGRLKSLPAAGLAR